MTLHATLSDGKVTIHGNLHAGLVLKNGYVESISITEDVMHVRSFWGQLGRLLAEAEGTTPGQRLYERYADHSGGKSLVTGEQLPSFPEQEDRIRDAWEHAAG